MMVSAALVGRFPDLQKCSSASLEVTAVKQDIIMKLVIMLRLIVISDGLISDSQTQTVSDMFSF